MMNSEYEEKSIALLEEISSSLKELISFFQSIEELNAGADDNRYNEELKKDGFHPKIG
jgi:hypothetical protein